MKSFKITNKITNRSGSEVFTKYLREINKITPFESADEEYLCAIKAKNGDALAMEELINRNLRFVISVAKSYHAKGIQLQDLVNEGNTGLIIAASKFDPSMGFKFISYAVWYIRRQINDYLSNHGKIIRLPINKLNDLHKLKMEVDKLEQIHGRDIFDVDLFDTGIDINNKLITDLINLDSTRVNSLDAPVSNDSDSGSLIELISDESCETTDHLVLENENLDILNKLLSNLTPQQRIVVKLSFGIGSEPKTLGEIGAKLNISKEGVRLIKNKSLKILKIKSRSMGINAGILN
jgi:RNA polymerase primary sigma factor